MNGFQVDWNCVVYVGVGFVWFTSVSVLRGLRWDRFCVVYIGIGFAWCVVSAGLHPRQNHPAHPKPIPPQPFLAG